MEAVPELFSARLSLTPLKPLIRRFGRMSGLQN